jgi:hypothetical protein
MTIPSIGGCHGSLTKEQRRAIARRIFAALSEHYPDRYIALAEEPENAGLAAAGAQSLTEIADSKVARKSI